MFNGDFSEALKSEATFPEDDPISFGILIEVSMTALFPNEMNFLDKQTAVIRKSQYLPRILMLTLKLYWLSYYVVGTHQ